jgi:hypothetical protein
MGWMDSHLHAFRLKDPNTGEPEEIGIPPDPNDPFIDEIHTIPDWEEKIRDWFSGKNKKAIYNYDFGDDWNHDLVLEKVLPKEENVKYPLCLAGERACPPEDCGGVGGYENLKCSKIIHNNMAETNRIAYSINISFE